MNELKDLCDRMVADAPPMPDSADVLRAARRSVALRNRVRIAGVAAVMVVATAAAVTVQANLHSGRTQPGPARVAAPGKDAARAHAKKMGELLAAAVPAGYTVTPVQPAADELRGSPVAGSAVRSWADATVELADGHGRGTLGASVWFVDPPGEPCVYKDLPVICQPTTVDGVAVEILWWTGQNRRVSVIRRFPGGYLAVGAAQAVTHYPNSVGPVVEPGLAVFPFTSDRIVALALDPALLPPR